VHEKSAMLSSVFMAIDIYSKTSLEAFGGSSGQDIQK
jgi:hypothetical protein